MKKLLYIYIYIHILRGSMYICMHTTSALALHHRQYSREHLLIRSSDVLIQARRRVAGQSAAHK